MEESRQLLVVSDNNKYQQWTASLADQGWRVFHFPLPLDKSSSVATACDLIIIDLDDLPEDLPAFLASHPQCDIVPVVSEEDTLAILQCYRMGCADVLLNPVTDQQVHGLISRKTWVTEDQQTSSVDRAQLEKINRDLRESLNILELDQKAGRQVQLSMLPERVTRCGEYEIAYDIVPSLYLSGDFVGYHIVFDRYILFYLADVSGHGASSAFITVMLHFLMDRIVRRHINSNDLDALARAPEGFLEHINRQIMALGVDKHLTIFSGSIDMQQHLLRYSVGAHMPTPIFMADGDARFLPGKGKAVGIFAEATWEVQEIALPEKFIMTATSDGVLEFVKGDKLSDKLSTMINVVAESDYSIVSICEELGIKGVKDAPDDVTVMTVRRGF